MNNYDEWLMHQAHQNELIIQGLINQQQLLHHQLLQQQQLLVAEQAVVVADDDDDMDINVGVIEVEEFSDDSSIWTDGSNEEQPALEHVDTVLSDTEPI